MEQSEEWRPVSQDERLEVSSLGRVRCRGVMRACRTDRTGYVVTSVVSARGAKPRSVHVHILVLWAFHGPQPPGYESCHNNGARSDNRAENLRWDTRKNNHADKRKHGTAQVGQRNGQAKLTSGGAIIIAMTLGIPMANRPTNRELAAVFKVTPGAIQYVRNGYYWTDATGLRRKNNG